MYHIGVVSGTRAEYGLLKPLLQKIEADDLLSLHLIVTGTHLEERFGYTCQEIEADGFRIEQKIPMDLCSDSPQGICFSMGKELAGIARAFEKADMDLLILLGDRYETLIAALAATVFHIPIAHIHGGEITEGAIDDAFRHAVTKMSRLHFTSTKEYADRIIQMGEPPESVHCVGAIGTENIRRIRLLSREALAAQYTPLFQMDYLMVTYHPATLDDSPVEEQMEALFRALSEFPEYAYIFTYANADNGGSLINDKIDEFVSHNSRAAAFPSLGQAGYLSALKYACAAVGNSSSGIVEAPSFHIPTVNIGDRQKGRISGESVLHCSSTSREIQTALRKAVTPQFRQKCRTCRNPYEGEDTSQSILTEVKKALFKGIRLQKKFYDIEV